MSRTDRTTPDTPEEQRELFESIKEDHPDDEALQLICDAVLQSLPSEASEEARS